MSGFMKKQNKTMNGYDSYLSANYAAVTGKKSSSGRGVIHLTFNLLTVSRSSTYQLSAED